MLLESELLEMEDIRKYRCNTEKEIVEKAILYSLKSNNIDRELLDFFTKNFTDDRRFKVKIIACTTFWNKHNCSGLAEYKKVIYHFGYNSKLNKISAKVYK